VCALKGVKNVMLNGLRGYMIRRRDRTEILNKNVSKNVDEIADEIESINIQSLGHSLLFERSITKVSPSSARPSGRDKGEPRLRREG
jgi:hypothetical protein